MEGKNTSFWKSSGGVAIIVAMIAGVLGIANTVISKSGWLGSNRPEQVVTAVQPSTGVDACQSARIVQPRVTRSRAEAKAFPVSRRVAVVWEPTECIMVVQYYQGDTLRDEWKQQVSGTEFDFRPPLDGETEIKIWREPPGVITDAGWVWVSQQ